MLFIIQGFYQPRQHQYHPSCINHPTCFVRPLDCNPLFNYPFHKTSYFEKINTNRVTVRRTTTLHATNTANDGYQVERNKDSDEIYLQPFNRIIAFSDQKFRTTPTTYLYERDYFHSNNQYIPSVPSQKIVPKNNGLHVSSTSFITISDEQVIITPMHY